MPQSEDIDDPQALIARLKARAAGEELPRDAMDEALDELLAQAAGEDDGRADDTPDDPRPV